MSADPHAVRAPTIGIYQGRTIPEWIEVNGHAGRFMFAGVAVTNSAGAIVMRQLAANECVIFPGLIYRGLDP